MRGFNEIKEDAEVITQDDIRDPLIETGGMSRTSRVTHEGQRAVGTLVDHLAPFEKGAKWAIDVTTQEFMIYKPK